MEHETESSQTPKASKKSKKTTIIALTIAVVSVLLILFLINATQAMILKLHLKDGRWEYIENTGGNYYLHILDISNDTITYRMNCTDEEAGIPHSEQRAAAVTVATYKYKTISRTKIKVLRENGEWETITVEFPFGDVLDDYSFMELYPAITTDGKKEEWYDF